MYLPAPSTRCVHYFMEHCILALHPDPQPSIQSLESSQTSHRSQVGLAEMKMAVEHTGGMSVQTDTFHNPVFKDSFKRVFAKEGDDGHMGMASNASFEVLTPLTPLKPFTA